MTTNVESVTKLMEASADYRDKIKSCVDRLENAIDECDQAMGHDDIAKKYIVAVEELMQQLYRCQIMAENMTNQLANDRRTIIDILENI